MSNDYGIRLKNAMAHAGLSQKELLAHPLLADNGVGQSSLSSAMNRASGSAYTALFARACGVDAVWLTTGAGEMVANDQPGAIAAPAYPANIMQIAEWIATISAAKERAKVIMKCSRIALDAHHLESSSPSPGSEKSETSETPSSKTRAHT